MRPRKISRSELSDIRSLDELRMARMAVRAQIARHEDGFARTWDSVRQVFAWTSLLPLVLRRAEDFGRVFNRAREVFELVRNAWQKRKADKKIKKARTDKKLTAGKDVCEPKDDDAPV